MEQARPSSFLITDFWQAAQPPRGYEEEVTRFRELIVQTQTTSCAHTCSVRKNLWVGGSAQNLRKLSHALLEATLQRCAIVGLGPSGSMQALPRARSCGNAALPAAGLACIATFDPFRSAHITAAVAARDTAIRAHFAF